MGFYGKRLWLGLGLVALLGAGIGAYYFFQRRPAEAPLAPGPLSPLPPAPSMAPGAPPPGKEVPFVSVPHLRESDEWLRAEAKELSAKPGLVQWLKASDLIRRITAAVDNISHGLSPWRHLKFLGPGKAISVVRKGDQIYLDPRSYRRYDRIADVFCSLDTAGTVRIFRLAKPLFQEAYRELGYPNRNFQETLLWALKELLSTPVVEGQIALKEAVVTYSILDEDLEDLSDAQKHLLRMGPQNMRKVQKKLREMALALGVPEGELPQARVYGQGQRSGS